MNLLLRGLLKHSDLRYDGGLPSLGEFNVLTEKPQRSERTQRRRIPCAKFRND